MGARLVMLGLGGLLAVVGIAVGILFVMQNMARTTTLTLDLYVGAWELSEPVPVMTLVGVGFGAGFLVCLVLATWRSLKTRKRIRSLENQVALGGDAGSFR